MGKKRLLSLFLAVMMLATVLPSAAFAGETTVGESYFDFESSEYLAGETDGTLEIRVYRHGSTEGAVNVAVKAADFLSTYGVDYELLIDGEPMAAVEGATVDPSQFVYQEEGKAQPAALTAGSAALPVSADVKGPAAQSALYAAQAEYLNLPTETNTAETESAAAELLTELYGFLADSRGAAGVLHFSDGELYRSITVRLADNATADGERMFLLGLMGTDAENTTVAANATTYVTISDDEPYAPAAFSLEAAQTVLTEDAPTAEVTVRRTEGLQYFSTAYLSTVTETADRDAYETLSLQTVSFAPGQETVTVPVAGLDFSRDGSFGVRLEAEEQDEVQTHYLSFTMESKNTVHAVGESAPLRAVAGTVLGDETITYGEVGRSWYELGGGFGAEVNGSDYPAATIREFDRTDGNGKGDHLEIYNENKGCYSMLYTKGPLDMVGLRSIRYKLLINDIGDEKSTWVELDDDQTFPGSTVGNYYKGNSAWSDDPGSHTLDTSGLWNWSGGYHYFKFSTRCEKNGNNNHARGEMAWAELHYALYSFDLQPCAEAMPGYLYDFTDLDGSGPRKVTVRRILGTKENGEPLYAENILYNPPALSMKTTGGTDIAGFYTNWSGEAVLEPASEPAPGLRLKGAYFFYDNPYSFQTNSYDSRALYVPVSGDGKVHVTLNRDFIRDLMLRGAISGGNTADAVIRVYPVYEEEVSAVDFDYLGCEPDAAGNYTSAANNARINNLDKCGLETKWYQDSFQYYTMTVPTGSVLRVSMTPAASRTAVGFRYWTWDGSISEVTYHKEGDHIVSGASNEGYTTVTVTDYTTADILVSGGMSMVPVTGAQDLYVGYFPSAAGVTVKRPDLEVIDPATGETTTTSDYTNAVIDYTNGMPEEGSVVGTDENGAMTVQGVRTGEQKVLMASPPSGYYTYWTDMTGDTDNNGKIDKDEEAAAGTRRRDATERSDNPMYVYGDYLSFHVDQDNTRYYYLFSESSQSGSTVTGRVVRESSTLYELSQGSEGDNEPVAGAYVNIAGAVGQTDASGAYSIELPGGLPVSGVVSGYCVANGSTYNIVGYIERFSSFVLPALEQFTARSVSAAYTDAESGEGMVADQLVTVTDGTLALTAVIGYDSAIVPIKAHFTIVEPNGSVKVNCDSAAGYQTAVETHPGGNGGSFTATLSFNPLQDMKSGDRVFVAFEDASGHVYTPIDTGLLFFSRLDLKDVLLPALGPTITDAVTTGFVADLIGDPLASFDMGKISGLGDETVGYTPDGIDPTEGYPGQYPWSRSTFTWNYSKEFEPNFKKGDSQKDTDKAVNDAGEAVKNTPESELKGTTISAQGETAAQSGGSFSTKGSYHFTITPTVGFQLTLTQRRQQDNSVKIFFEDLVLYVKCDSDASTEQIIETPIGINVLIRASLTKDGDNSIITGIYRMYVDYQTTNETEDAVPYDESFALFKTSNDHRRHEGYIFLNPVITVRLGVGVGVAYIFGEARFAFDMDFRFTGDKTYSYGALNMKGEWGIQILNFDVYTNTFAEGTVKLFSQNTDSPFGFGDLVSVAGSNNGGLQSAAANLSNLMGDRDAPFAPTLTDRSYLEGRSEWSGGTGGLLRGATLGTVEAVLQTGSSHNQQFRIVPFGSQGQALAVFVDDAPGRSAANSRAVYYSVRGTDGNWSNPVIVDDDGTIDDYPYAEDLDDGRIMVAWSSGDYVLDDDVSLETSLQHLMLEYAIFDTNTRTMGPGKYLTHATELDISSDLRPRIAYDKGTGKAILYYIKTEYKDLHALNDLSKAYSAVAYLLYDKATGKWSNTGDSYTNAELAGMTDPDAYRRNWYGQRFLDLRLDGAAGTLPLVIESEAIDYNGMGLFVYTVDWDRDQSTLNDRDIFLQTYDFATDSFTPIIRITPKTGCYADPELEDSNNTAYLFYGVSDPETGEGTIRVLNIGHYLTKGAHTEVTDGVYEVQADVATVCHNLQDYTTVVTDEGKLCLLWTDVPDQDKGRDIHAVIYNNQDGADDENAPEPNLDEPNSLWSQPVALTNSGKDTFYTGFGAMAYDGAIVILSSKGSFSNRNSHGIVQVVHRPFARVELDSALRLSDAYAAEGDRLSVTATLRNVGLKQDHDGETVTFYVNGAEAAVVNYDKFIPGGDEARVSTMIVVPAGDVTITATCSSTTVSATLQRGPRLSATNEALGRVRGKHNVPTYERDYSAVLFNTGNADTGALTLTAAAGDRVLAETTLPGIAPKSFCDAALRIPFHETLYSLDEVTGLASLDVEITVSAGGKVLHRYDDTLTRQYNAEAIAALKTCQGVSGLEFRMNVDDFELLQPTITGENLTVEWLRTSNPEVAWLDWSGAAYAAGEGTATLTGIVAPSWTVQKLNSDGTFRQKDWTELVPSYLLRPVTATVRVGSADDPVPYIPSTPTSAEITVEVSSDEGSVTVSATVEGNTATITAPTAEQIAEITDRAGETGAVTIDLSSLPETVTAVSIPAETVKAISEAMEDSGKGLTIKLPGSTVTFDPAALAAIADQTDGKELKLCVEPIAESKLNAKQRDAISELDVQAVYNVYLLSGGKRISDFGGGTATVEVSYPVSDGKSPGGYAVWYVADTGEKTEMPTTATRKTVKWTVPHLSSYVLAYDEEKAKECPRDETCPMAAFADLDPTAWYHDGVHFCLENGMMNGVGNGLFDPGGATSRAMIVTILWRLEGEPKATGANPFTDVADGQWYTDAVIWAAENKIVEGYEDGTFRPTANITREQLATILYRYAQSKGQSFTGAWMFLLDYPDAVEISEWADEAMHWCVMNGIINGKDGKLVPCGEATRAEAATMLMRFQSEAESRRS